MREPARSIAEAAAASRDAADLLDSAETTLRTASTESEAAHKLRRRLQELMGEAKEVGDELAKLADESG